ncbi:hypothetical protein ACWEQ0_23800 [Nocardia thailandica]
MAELVDIQRAGPTSQAGPLGLPGRGRRGDLVLDGDAVLAVDDRMGL